MLDLPTGRRARAGRRAGHAPRPRRRRRPAPERRPGRGAPRRHRVGRVPCVRLSPDLPPGRAQPALSTNAHRINDGEPPPRGGPATRTPTSSSSSGATRSARGRPIVELLDDAHPRSVRARPDPRHAGAGADEPRPRRCGRAQPRAAGRAESGRRRAARGARTFRVGDKVMQLRNDYDRSVFNGDVGLVSSIDPEENTLTVRFDDRDVVFDGPDADDLVLAYA